MSKVGVLMLDTAFYRPVGDIGNADTWAGNVCYHKIRGAFVSEVVSQKALSPDLLDAFTDAALELENEGVSAIATSCGFLGGAQNQIADRLTVPFVSSALLWVERLKNDGLAEEEIAVLTFDGAVLADRHFPSKVKGKVKVCGLPLTGTLPKAIRNDEIWFDQQTVCNEIIELATRFVEGRPDLKCLVLECTNLSPYRSQIEEVVSMPVCDINQLIRESMAG